MGNWATIPGLGRQVTEVVKKHEDGTINYSYQRDFDKHVINVENKLDLMLKRFKSTLRSGKNEDKR